MAWLIDLSGRKTWAREAIDALRAAGLNVESTAESMSKTVVGIILAAEFSVGLQDALAAVDPCRQRAVVIGPPDGTLDPWPVLAAGAAECVAWHGHGAAISAWAHRADDVEGILDSKEVRGRLKGASRALRVALRDLVVAARYGNAPILILGETGTGKELAAGVAHAVSNQRGGLVVVDSTTIVPALMGSELFGHERGAFTGAVSVRTGACSAADQGSLFLDEVGELPLELQPGLLRVIQEGAYKRVGGDRWLHSSFRLICATNRDLRDEVASGSFRADLYYRIAAATVTMPPLRDRLEDVLGLFAGFCREASGACDEPVLDRAVEELLLHREYPGNLRDLRQLAARVAARHVGAGPITPGDFPAQDRPVALHAPLGGVDATSSSDVRQGLRSAMTLVVERGMGLHDIKEWAGDAAVEVALEQCGGNLAAAAAMLEVTERALQLRQNRRTASP
ncbi:sigma 54-interacting transcriptional regulator [Kocuria sabuli]|uniref:sigma 54-interacting transcriptional regulator n=1 Tax=Kocuria sabuli TaxID=3071448 RepID=UPI0034D44EE7